MEKCIHFINAANNKMPAMKQLLIDVFNAFDGSSGTSTLQRSS